MLYPSLTGIVRLRLPWQQMATDIGTASHYPKEERKLLRKLDLAILVFGSLSCESEASPDFDNYTNLNKSSAA